MEYILQFARILGFCLAGEALHHLLPLPVPSSIYGLILLFLALETGLLKVQQVKAASAWLISVFAVMFVPGTVGVMELWDVMARLLVPILLAVFVITALVFLVTGHVTQALLLASGYTYQTMKLKAREKAAAKLGSQAAEPSGQTAKPSGQTAKPSGQGTEPAETRNSSQGGKKGKQSKSGKHGKKGGRK